MGSAWSPYFRTSAPSVNASASSPRSSTLPYWSPRIGSSSFACSSGSRGRPVDVEEDRRRRAGAVLEQVVPPGIRCRSRCPCGWARSRRCGRMPCAASAAEKLGVRLGAADLRIDLVVVADVIAVRAAGLRREIRRRVAGVDAQARQVRHDVARRRQREPGVKTCRRYVLDGYVPRPMLGGVRWASVPESRGCTAATASDAWLPGAAMSSPPSADRRSRVAECAPSPAGC